MHTVLMHRPCRLLGQRVVMWRTVRGAAGYGFTVDTDATGRPFTTDTAYVLRDDRDPRERPAMPRFRLVAMDANLYRFLTDTLLVRAGLTGGYGVFGAISVAEISLARGPL